MPGHFEQAVRQIAQQFGLTPQEADELGRQVEEQKRGVGMRGNDNLPPQVIAQIAQGIVQMRGRRY